jgi:acetyl-CoA acetyltransferase family protein
MALLSQQKTGRAMADGTLAEETVPVQVKQARGEPLIVEKDEHPRPSTTAEALAKLRPAFAKDGTVTAGNSSGINDGAAALLVTSAERARAFGLAPLARIVSTAVAGVKPDEMGLGPIPASRKVLQRAGMQMDQMQIVELNEAFASQVIACLDDLGVDWRDEERVNPNGGAIALGHPLGASGARLAGTAAMQLQRTGAHHALVTMCIGVGQGIATILETGSET